MGGQAFNAQYPEAKFPRMSHAIYAAMKDRLRLIVETLYEKVVVPHEAPEKVDHGDVDFLVRGPRPGLTHEDVKEGLGARYSVPAHPTSHYAVPTDIFGDGQSECFIQVDVHVCKDEEDLYRVHFLHSYGDLGIILGHLAASVGLSFGQSGLKLANPVPINPPNMPFYLSSSIPHILEFFEISLRRWEQGFSTTAEAFDWVSSSSYFIPTRLARPDVLQGSQKRAKASRTMFQDFLDYTATRALSMQRQAIESRDVAIERALRHFDKWDLYQTILHTCEAKQRIKQIFTGKLVMEWTGVQGTPVRWIMEEVQRKLEAQPLPLAQEIDASTPLCHSVKGSELVDPSFLTLAPWQILMKDLTVEQVKDLVVEVKEGLQRDGKLQFDWQEAKKRKAERKALLESQPQPL
ncbi:unnamed protein product [Somion occarium]|uniref:Uncharacterized protein n=1 Tax=Somion occarium TaxID=3059160 RepID=A0ABP1E006_9APHY